MRRVSVNPQNWPKKVPFYLSTLLNLERLQVERLEDWIGAPSKPTPLESGSNI
jgi:hypothetical protein